MDMNALREQVAACRNCPLCEGRTNTVFGTGNEKADIMFIGEAPGKNEDLTGEPFVGAAGRLLNDYLTACGLSRGDVYIANILKCRPPQNRDPLPAEEDCCIAYLERQIELVNPKLIVCLGRIAAKRLIDPDFAVTKQHGELRRRNGRLIMGTFHPAALLRNGANKAPTLADFEKIAALRQRNFETD